MADQRFFLSQDNDSHWYIIPVDKRVEWNDWLELDEDDEPSWMVPEFAKAVGGNPSLITFTDPF